MAKYSSKPAIVSAPIVDAYQRLTDTAAFQQRVEAIPEEQRKMIGDIKFTENSISMNTPQVGEIQFDVIERTAPTRLVYSAAKSPVPLALAVKLSEKSDSETEIVSEVEVDIPAMLRPLIGGKMQEAANKFNELILTICNV